jgi:hypothetical protein
MTTSLQCINSFKPYTLAGFETGIFCSVGGRDDHYTTPPGRYRSFLKTAGLDSDPGSFAFHLFSRRLYFKQGGRIGRLFNLGGVHLKLHNYPNFWSTVCHAKCYALILI